MLEFGKPIFFSSHSCSSFVKADCAGSVMCFTASSSHADVGASDPPRHRVLCAQCALWRPEPAPRSPRYRKHITGEEIQIHSVSLKWSHKAGLIFGALAVSSNGNNKIKYTKHKSHGQINELLHLQFFYSLMSCGTLVFLRNKVLLILCVHLFSGLPGKTMVT